MTPLTQEWVQKAEADFAAMEWLRQAPDSLPDALGFHAQQCVEKYLKARAQHAGIAFPKTHDLENSWRWCCPSSRDGRSCARTSRS